MSLVSVYIPTKSRPSLAARAANSVNECDTGDIEIIIVDDHSSKEDWTHLNDHLYGQDNIRIIRNYRKPGACGARNSAIEVSKGEFVTGLDDDDIFLPGRISQLLEAHKEFGTSICTNYKEFFEASQRTRELNLSKEGRLSTSDLLKKNVVGNQIFARKEVFQQAGGFDEDIRCWQDYDMWVRVSKNGNPIRKIWSNSYQINIANNRNRISNSIDRAQGILRFLEKHGDSMSENAKFGHYLSYLEKRGELLTAKNLYNSMTHGALLSFSKKIIKSELLNSKYS